MELWMIVVIVVLAVAVGWLYRRSARGRRAPDQQAINQTRRKDQGRGYTPTGM